MSGTHDTPRHPAPTSIPAPTPEKPATSVAGATPVETARPKVTEKWNAETWSTVVTAISTLLTLIVAVLLGLHSMMISERTVTTLSENVKQANLLGIYTLNLETSRFFDANPKLLKFFDKLYRKTMTDKELREEYDKLDEQQKSLALLGCDKLADLMQVTFLQRERLPDADWNNWWSGMCEQYDESPLLREYLMQRHTNYAFINAIKPEARDQFFRGEKSR